MFAVGNKDNKVAFYDFRMLMNNLPLKDNKVRILIRLTLNAK